MIVIKNSPFELNIKCHTTDIVTLIYDIQLTANDIRGTKRKYTMTNLIEDYVYQDLDTYLTGLDYAPLLDEEIKNLTVKNLRQDKNDWLIDIEFTISNGIDTYKGTIKNIILCSTNSRIKLETTGQTIKDMSGNNLATYFTDVLLNIDENTFKFRDADYHNLCDLERITQ